MVSKVAVRIGRRLNRWQTIYQKIKCRLCLKSLVCSILTYFGHYWWKAKSWQIFFEKKSWNIAFFRMAIGNIISIVHLWLIPDRFLLTLICSLRTGTPDNERDERIFSLLSPSCSNIQSLIDSFTYTFQIQNSEWGMRESQSYHHNIIARLTRHHPHF